MIRMAVRKSTSFLAVVPMASPESRHELEVIDYQSKMQTVAISSKTVSQVTNGKALFSADLALDY